MQKKMLLAPQKTVAEVVAMLGSADLKRAVARLRERLQKDFYLVNYMGKRVDIPPNSRNPNYMSSLDCPICGGADSRCPLRMGGGYVYRPDGRRR